MARGKGKRTGILPLLQDVSSRKTPAALPFSADHTHPCQVLLRAGPALPGRALQRDLHLSAPASSCLPGGRAGPGLSLGGLVFSAASLALPGHRPHLPAVSGGLLWGQDQSEPVCAGGGCPSHG